MTLVGKNIKLKGKSQKGKNRVREHGADWTVLAETDHVLFAAGRQGPWLYVTPIGKKQDDNAARWVHAHNDEHFVVVVQEVDNTLD